MRAIVFLMLAACGTEHCPTYQDVQPIIARSCLGCHSVEVRGANRQGAPREADYDTFAETKEAIDVIVTRVSMSGGARMPPATSNADKVSSSQVQTLAAWKSCGAPE